ncbi:MULTISPECIES: hypothetical protein [Streptomyces]|uniref:Uncharacterized protein n=2 Tax=Streptomyces TaxID=1883 RepID=A0A286DTX3_9ACTN|nr:MULTISPECIES: hypothetical protein [Streptomyces]TNM32678.1 hypothetical protein FH715_04930 [Streptomyces sedi]SOD62091.1 hypothetical protein SAMN06297387_104261 [Streptomyces zhaozhouensis]
MTSALSIPLVVLLGAMTFLLVRGRSVRGWEAALIALFGFHLALTPIGPALLVSVEWLFSGFAQT